MVVGMAIFQSSPTQSPARNDVTEWLAGRGSAVVTVVAVAVVAVGAVMQGLS